MNNFVLRSIMALVLVPFFLLFVYLGNWYLNFLLFLILILGFYEIIIINNNYIKVIILIFFLTFLFLFYIIRNSYNGLAEILLCIFITWISDIGGYLFGKIFAGKKINIISPNKTYSGFVGALFLPQILAIILNKINFFLDKDLYYYFFIVFYLSLSAVVGDLFFSYLKRLVKIKDFSRLIPGHGGLFDRIDSLIFVIICFFIFNII